MNNWIYNAILKRRSIRKFKQKTISFDILKKCANAGRMAPSSGNIQPWKFIIANENVDEIFKALSWANYLEKGKPSQQERPPAYIIIICDKQSENDMDIGMAAENIILTTLDFGIGSCPIGSVDKDKLNDILEILDEYVIKLVIALVYPKENPVIEEGTENNIKYWMDKTGQLHVPKKNFEEIVYHNKYGNTWVF